MATFPNVQFPKWKLPNSVLAAVLGPPACYSRTAQPLAHPWHSGWPPLEPAVPLRAYTNLWEIAAWEIAHLGSCHLGNSHL